MLKNEEGLLQGTNQDEMDIFSYRTFFQDSKQAQIITNEKLKIIEINKRAAHILKSDINQCIGKSMKDFLEKVPEGVLRYQMVLLKKEGSYRDEWLLNDLNGNYSHMEFEGVCNGKHYCFSLRDVTSYKKNEKDFMIATDMFQDLFTRITDGILIFDAHGKLIEVNGAFLSIVEMDKEEVIGENFWKFLTPQSKEKWAKEWHILFDTGKIVSTTELYCNGRYYFFEYSVHMNVYNQQFISVFKDATEKKLIELQLQESKELFAHIFNQAIDAIVLMDERGYVFEMNEVACRIFEAEKGVLIGAHIEDFVMKKDKKYCNAVTEFSYKGELREELFYLMPNGQRKLLEFTAKKMDNTNTIVTIFRNVSERYEMEVKLRKSEKRFRKIFDGMLDGLILWSGDQLVDINEAGMKILNLPKEKIISMTKCDLIHILPNQHKAINNMMKKLETYHSVEEVVSFTLRNGKKMHFEFSSKKNLVSGLNLTVFKDVTEKLEMQEQLRKSDTLSVVGELAAGIAHEIRNPMTAIKGFIQLMQASLQENFSDYFGIITSELQRIDSIITEFLILAKPQAVQYEEQDINLIVKDTLALLRAESMLHSIVFTERLFEGGLRVYCEANQLKQVLINIIKNAIESMQTGGTIMIETEKHDNETVKISVADEGCGIPEEKIKKLGEPFYTTKDRGTGLGMMVSYKIIEEHNGWIDVESKVGNGTVFSIFLPVHSKKESIG